MLPVGVQTVMSIVGAMEVIAGLLVAARPQILRTVVAIWLWAIIVTLLLMPGDVDVRAT